MPAVSPSAQQSVFLRALQSYFEAFAELEADKRIALLSQAMVPQAEIWGPKRVFAGYGEISEKIAGFHKNWPDCRLVLTSGVNAFQNAARFGKAIVGSDGKVLAEGHSVVELAEDGRIQRIIPFWDALPPLPSGWPEHLATARQ